MASFGGWRATVALVPILLWVSVAAAAEGDSRIEGQVTAKGSGVAAVTVLINELKATTETDAEGRFVFPKVPPGTYNLVLSLGDYTEVHPLTVAAGEPTRVEYAVDWQIGGYAEVAVTAVGNENTYFFLGHGSSMNKFCRDYTRLVNGNRMGRFSSSNRNDTEISMPFG